jgi:hypothetical protein
VGRQIINTGGQGLAASDAAKSALGAIVVAGIVLLLFFGLNAARLGHPPAGAGTPAAAAPAPMAT